ncbi:alpha/beta hydrolase [Azospirillum sp.]|uniref:alpha/beta fold hydrolase n=1 Tax=Azospirillum sp. TaxID=34012 RepID=UPI002D3984EA|nr:alpha/beta hydrolase [Azospirillum sp.]HYD63930.1 alpha/beta hydrolase [Azospirillum sp.]
MRRTKPLLVLVHGWAFDHRVWEALRAALPDYDAVTVDLGFFGSSQMPDLPADRPLVAVGHSLGVLWLLARQPFAWAGMVSINGFPRFIEGPDYAPAVAPRVLDRMIARFSREPEAVVDGFRRRCGLAAPRPHGFDNARLLEGLEWLRDLDARTALDGRPLLALAGAEDPVVSPGMAEMAFGVVIWQAAGGHLLPLTHPMWCAGLIRAFVEGVVP